MAHCSLSSVVTIVLLAAIPAVAQLPSNASLNGAFYVRYLGVNTDASPSETPLSFGGTMTFDGNGHYSVNGTQVTFTNGATQTKTLSASGTYQVMSSGMLYLDNVFDPLFSTQGTTLYGGLGTGPMITASSTDTFYCDLFVAVPVSTSNSNAKLTGKYYVASLEFLNGNITTSTRDTFFPVTADGSGNLGNVTVSGTALNLSSATTTQTSTGATYSVKADGSGTITFPAPSGVAASNVLLSGAKNLYVSPDGSFFMAGSAGTSSGGYDLVLGVQALTAAASTSSYNGLFFTSYLENYAAGTNADGVYSSQGAANDIGAAGLELAHERLNPDGFQSYDSMYSDNFTVLSDGTQLYADYLQFAVGAGGNIVLEAGNGHNYELGLYVKIPTLSGSGVFLNPVYVQNAATFIPFTAQVSPGEVISLYGTGLASQNATLQSLPFPPTLANVSVTINGTTAPVYSVVHGALDQINVVVPYSTPTDGSLLNIQVTNNGVKSNTVQEYSGATSPGLFTLTANGIGNGAILHANYSVVTPSNPAKVGETILVFLTGLGAVSPAVTAGNAAPGAEPLARVTDQSLAVYIDGFIAGYNDGTPPTLGYAGLAPLVGGLYQLNVTIPSGVSTGTNVYIEISTIDADNAFEATIPIGK